MQKRIDGGPNWAKGLKMDKAMNLLFCWSKTQICFTTLDKLKRFLVFENLTSEEDFITDVLLAERFKYFITGTYRGNLYVRKLTEDKDLVHHFNMHTKAITSLAPHQSNRNLFFSASKDFSVKMWCLDVSRSSPNSEALRTNL